MNFLYPLAFIGLISIPIIIAMYLLKQNYTEYKSSSNVLWAKAATKSFAQKPWQKLRKEILMILQILAALLLVFALSGPFILNKGEAESYIFVLDASLSMQATDKEGSRFEYAKKELEKAISDIPPSSNIALIVAEKEPYIAVNFTDDKKSIIDKIKQIKVTNTSVDEDGLSSITKSLFEQNNSNIFVFSDYGFDFENLPVTNFSTGEAINNTAITLMSNSVDADKIVSLVKIKNYGKITVENSVALYNENNIIDIKNFSLLPGEETSVFFTNVPVYSKTLMAKLSNQDLLAIDDIYYDTIDENATEKAIIFSEKNIFIESILKLMPSLEVYKGETSNINNISGYFLYIFDGILPEEMPTDGHVLIFNPPIGNGLIETSEEVEVGSIYVNESSFLNFIEDINFGILKSKQIKEPIWADTVLSSDIGPLVIAGEENGQKRVIFAFDLHNSDFPLKKEFPIFFYNLIQWFVPEKVYEGERLYVDESITLNIYPSSESVKIAMPDGSTYTLAPPFPIGKFSDNTAPGFYTLEQVINGEGYYSSFAVNIKDSAELNLNKEKSYILDDSSYELLSNKNYNLKNICLIIALILILAEWFFLNRGKFKIPDLIRSIVIVLLILSFFDIEIKTHSDNVTTIFAFDMSESFSDNIKIAENEVNKAIEKKGSNDIIGAVAFGQNAYINTYPSNEIEKLNFNSSVEADFTNISDGLILSQSIIAENTQKRIVLISDGKENIGDSQSFARNLSSQGIPVDVYYMESGLVEEVQISKINVPKNLNKGSSYNIDINAYSLSENSGKLLVYKNEKLIISQEIALKSGDNRFVFSDKSDSGGNIIYRAVIEPEKDTIYENNISYAYSYVDDVANVLIVSLDESGYEISKIVDNSGVNYDIINPVEIPAEIEWINKYDGIVLANISIDDMHEDLAGILEGYTKAGGGIIAIGGDNSFALGGYHDTKLEELLPVSMELIDEEELPNQGMVIVLDRSGSMSSGMYGMSKLDLAKEAVIRSIDALSENDYFGVLAFDTENIWISDFAQVPANTEGISDKVASISLGGGTSILPALEEAYNKLKEADTKLKHIILLTDGQDNNAGYDKLISQIKADGITISTVSVGSDADTALLEHIAEEAGGRYYYSDEFTDLPKIFTKEAFMAGKKYINNEEFYPIVGDNTPILEDVSSLPAIGGYIASSKKTRADVPLYVKDDIPLLASWQYGLGRSVAYLSDYNGHWSNMLINTDEGNRLFRNMLSFTLRKQLGADISVDIEVVGESSNIKVKLPTYSENEYIDAKIISPDMEETDIRLRITSPSEYEANIPFSNTGAYLLNLQVEEDENISSFVTGFNIPYSPEYNIEGIDIGEQRLRKIAEITGGRFLPNLSNVFETLDQNIYKKYNINYLLIILLILLFIFDIALRRFPTLKRYIINKIPRLKINKNVKTKDLQILEVNQRTLKTETNKERETENLAKNEVNPKNKEAPQPPDKKSTSNLLLNSKKKRSGR